MMVFVSIYFLDPRRYLAAAGFVASRVSSRISVMQALRYDHRSGKSVSLSN